ncbi:MAG TPA: barstar family protein [Alcanivoracaceae bacterium]|nr:barstar family protein [Alcanivoracaceae bacterium]
MRHTITLPADVNKELLLSAMENTFHFPSHFGHNWDALWDALDEYLGEHTDTVVLTIDKQAVKNINQDEWKSFLDILHQAAERWAQFRVHVIEPTALL